MPPTRPNKENAMVKHALLALAVTLSLGGGAFAQTSSGSSTGNTDDSGSQTDTSGSSQEMDTSGTTGTAAGDHALPRTWEGDIGNAFFADPQGRTLRSQSEVQRNWSSLTAEQQAQVKVDCQNMSANSSTTTGSTTGSTTTESTSTVGSEVAPPRESAHSVMLVCDWVNGL
jgi:hypothetical protein